MKKVTVPQAVFETKIARQIAKLATKQATEILENTPRHMLDEGNPNHPMYDEIFGYDREIFLAKQYK